MSSWFDTRIAVTIVASMVVHAIASETLSWLPEREAPARKPRRMEVAVVERQPPPPPPPEPEPIKPPEPPPPPPPEPVKQPPPKVTPKPQPKVAAQPSPQPTPTGDPTPSATPSTTTTAPGSTAQPVFGVSMDSTSANGSGPAVKTGNSTSPSAPQTGEAKPGAAASAPVPATEVTKMPMPRGRCAGKYTDEARANAIEGVVVLDLVVDANGRAQNVTVVEGLSHGLTEAAVAALKACTFTPGERAGTAVPVRVRGFKIRFLLDE